MSNPKPIPMQNARRITPAEFREMYEFGNRKRAPTPKPVEPEEEDFLVQLERERETWTARQWYSHVRSLRAASQSIQGEINDLEAQCNRQLQRKRREKQEVDESLAAAERRAERVEEQEEEERYRLQKRRKQ